MSRRLLFVIVAGLALRGCAESARSDRRSGKLGWARSPDVKRLKARKTSDAVASKDSSPTEDELSKLKPYSQEWTAVLDGINRAADDKLRRKLIICRGCMPPETDDQTGSMAVGGSLSFRQ